MTEGKCSVWLTSLYQFSSLTSSQNFLFNRASLSSESGKSLFFQSVFPAEKLMLLISKQGKVLYRVSNLTTSDLFLVRHWLRRQEGIPPHWWPHCLHHRLEEGCRIVQHRQNRLRRRQGPSSGAWSRKSLFLLTDAPAKSAHVVTGNYSQLKRARP